MATKQQKDDSATMRDPKASHEEKSAAASDLSKSGKSKGKDK